MRARRQSLLSDEPELRNLLSWNLSWRERQKHTSYKPTTASCWRGVRRMEVCSCSSTCRWTWGQVKLHIQPSSRTVFSRQEILPELPASRVRSGDRGRGGRSSFRDCWRRAMALLCPVSWEQRMRRRRNVGPLVSVPLQLCYRTGNASFLDSRDLRLRNTLQRGF